MSAAVIDLFEEITSSTVASVSRQLKLAGNRAVNLRINSLGGNCAAGFAVIELAREHRAGVHCTVYGLAASMASAVVCACRSAVMAENAWFMVHNPWVGGGGDARQLRRTADELDKIAAQLSGIYCGKTGLPESEIRELMDRETWLTAHEAKDMGFVDRVGPAGPESQNMIRLAAARFPGFTPALARRADSKPVQNQPVRRLSKHRQEIEAARAAYSKMKPGPARLAFFRQHKHWLF